MDNAKALAAQFLATMKPDPADVHDFIWEPDRDDTDANALVGEIVRLLESATITATFPGEEAATVQATLLRAFADKIDRGPQVPMLPRVFSALARETADQLDAQAAGQDASEALPHPEGGCA